MSKKDYIIIAKAIAMARVRINLNIGDTQTAIDHMQSAIEQCLKHDNDRFDVSRFRDYVDARIDDYLR